MGNDILLVEDVALFRGALAALLRLQGWAVREAGDLPSAQRLLGERTPKLLISDVRIKPEDRPVGIKLASQLRGDHPRIPILLLSHSIEVGGLQVLFGRPGCAGFGYLIKHRVGSPNEFMAALNKVVSGEVVLDPEVADRLLATRGSQPLSELTNREREVLTLMAQGLSNMAISRQCYLSERTVESHVRSIFAKLGLPPETEVHRRVAAVLRMLQA